MSTQRYPIGRQTFADIREEGLVYVDKTDLVYDLVTDGPPYISLSRRFGKSLLVSTLEAYFQGRRELFDGLAISQLEQEWTQYPVLRMDMSGAKHRDVEQVERFLDDVVGRYEKIYGRREIESTPGQRLEGIVRRARKQTGRRVVVLIDNYDTPMLHVMPNEEVHEKVNRLMYDFYATPKGLDEHLHFVFLTGLTTLCPPSIFGGLHNVHDISMLPRYAAICGITEQEMTAYFAPGIERLAAKEELGYDETVARLKAEYGGFRLAWPSPDICMPFSLLNALDDGRMNSYWLGGTVPDEVRAMVRRYGVTPASFQVDNVDRMSFNGAAHPLMGLTPLLYHSGWLTIKNYDREVDGYCLGIPSGEARSWVMWWMLYDYVAEDSIVRAMQVPTDMRLALLRRNVNKALSVLRAFLDTCQYCAGKEGQWRQVMHIMFAQTGLAEVSVEEWGNRYRMDVLIKTPTDVYVLEKKINETAKMAFPQISRWSPVARFAPDGRPVTKVELEVSDKGGTFTGWRGVRE